MTLGVLWPRSAEVHPDAPIDRRRASLAVLVDRQAADEHDAATVDELTGNATKFGAERRQRERLARDIEDVVALGLRDLQRGVELLDVGVGQLEDVARTDEARYLRLMQRHTRLRAGVIALGS